VNEKSIGQALKGFRAAARVARVFQAGQVIALGCAAASLVVGGVRAVRRIRGTPSV